MTREEERRGQKQRKKNYLLIFLYLFLSFSFRLFSFHFLFFPLVFRSCNFIFFFSLIFLFFSWIPFVEKLLRPCPSFGEGILRVPSKNIREGADTIFFRAIFFRGVFFRGACGSACWPGRQIQKVTETTVTLA